jgi:NADH-quinone oxidoreductase subunit G
MSDPIHIEINGRALPAAKGQMIIQVADAHGEVVPRFCYHHKLRIAANCRMCLVEVEKMPKPVPACATPVADGMKVYTRSPKALEAQRAVMEFLLINHPLDCPICDEGGECELQDTALGFGMSHSRYTEMKRVVGDPDLGPLIATEMTRCIHCTRCVRFGEDVAGIKELGATGRGEAMRIGTYVARAVESEISGNVIDLCPVGALTSKPYRFTARAWELARVPSISPHDCLGSHLELDVVHGKVMRTLPRVCEPINEEWLSDRDRYAYAGLHAPDRLLRPQLRRADGAWAEVDWPEALAAAADGLRHALDAGEGDALGVLLAPTLSTEELYLAQKLARALGSPHVDHRLRALDVSGQEHAPLYPGLPEIAALEQADLVVLVGCNLRQELPLLNVRVRKAVIQRRAAVYALNVLGYDANYPLAGSVSAPPGGLVEVLGDLAAAVAGGALPPAWRTHLGERGGSALPDGLVDALRAGKRTFILLGEQAYASSHAGALRALAGLLAVHSGATLGELTPGSNAAGAWLAGAVPHRGPGGHPAERTGLAAHAMLAHTC